MTKETTYYLIGITHKAPLTKQIGRDLPKRLEQAAYDFIQARGADCVNATAKQVEEPGKVAP
jgi:hypothetical protein